MDATVEQNTLRDTVSAAFDAVVEAPTEVATSTAVEKPRDEVGRFAKENKVETPVVENEQPQPKLTDRPSRPSSWKKDYDKHWETLDPELVKYIHQREGEFAKGVSTYKHEAERSKEIQEAIAPFLPNLQKYGLQPTQWIRNLGNAHERLAFGSPQEKAAIGAQLIKQYGIDPQSLYQLLTGAQQAQPLYQQPQPQQPPVNFEKLIEDKLTEKEIAAEFNKFLADTSEKYPHYEAVKETMAGLLQAGLAKDYPSAYEAALRLPSHADLFAEQQQQLDQQKAEQQAKQKQAVVNRARSNAVSVKSSTPTGQMAQVNGAKSLRDMLSDSFETVMSSRV